MGSSREYLEIEEGKYPKYSNFKSRILIETINKISSTTDLNIHYRELKRNGEILTTNKGPGNKVYSIEFVITNKEKFDAAKYRGKKFKATDGKTYMILKVEKQDNNQILVKLFDEDTEEITKLARPISINELIKHTL